MCLGCDALKHATMSLHCTHMQSHYRAGLLSHAMRRLPPTASVYLQRCFWCHRPGSDMHNASCADATLAGWGYTRRALSKSGAMAAAAVGLCTLGCSLRFGATLIAFFYASSKLTQYKEELKAGLDEAAKKGGQRDWRQVSRLDSNLVWRRSSDMCKTSQPSYKLLHDASAPNVPGR